MNGQKRQVYIVSNESESFIAYLFWDNVLFWEQRGYTVTKN